MEKVKRTVISEIKTEQDTGNNTKKEISSNRKNKIMDKEEQKALKKKLKAEAKIAKAREKEKAPSPPPSEKKKSWRDNVFLYSLVAIMIGIILWFLAYLFDMFFGPPQIPGL